MAAMAAAGETLTYDDVVRRANARAESIGLSVRGYRVRWHDVRRGTQGGALSCWGPDITDVVLALPDTDRRTGKAVSSDMVRSASHRTVPGERLPAFANSTNMADAFGTISASKLALQAPVVDTTGQDDTPSETALSPVTLERYLREFGVWNSIRGCDRNTDLYCPEMDGNVSVRFQCVPILVPPGGNQDFTTAHYNYQTHSDDDPKNVIGIFFYGGEAMQQDGEAMQRMYMQRRVDGKVVNTYFNVADTGIKAAKSQEQGSAADDAVMGTRTMGIKSQNVVLAIQVPIMQKPKRVVTRGGGTMMPVMRGAQTRGGMNVGRVSHGSVAGTYKGFKRKDLVRDRDHPVTVTVTRFFAITGPLTDDDLRYMQEENERGRRDMDWVGTLFDAAVSTPTAEPAKSVPAATKLPGVTAENMEDIQRKIEKSPPVLVGATQFP
jgi:hypothetical protein